MNFSVDAPLRRFRTQVRRFLRSPEVCEAVAALDGPDPDVRPVYRLLGRERFLAADWPAEYGGLGLRPLEAGVVMEEMGRAGVPDTPYVLTIQVVGRMILMAGTTHGRQTYLPRMARGDLLASILYSEPDAGSDLAALTTEARPEAGRYRLYGRKVYSLKTGSAGVALCAARTGPGRTKYEGISLFLIPLDAEGVHVRPLPSISDEQFHDVLLDGVAVGGDDVVGTIGEGWSLVAKSVSFERTGIDFCVRAQRWYRAALERLACTASAPSDLLGEIGRFGARIDSARLLAWQALTKLSEGEIDDGAGAAAKWYASELAQAIAYWAHDHGGAAAWAADGTAAASALLEAACREAPGLTLSAGASEVMLQTIASARLAIDD